MDTIQGSSDRLVRHCPLCSRRRTPADAAGLGWSSHHGPGGVVYVCGDCTRAHLFELETGVLDPARAAGAGDSRAARVPRAA